MKKIIYFAISVFLLFPTFVLALEDKDAKELTLDEVMEFAKPQGYNSFQGMAITDKYFVVATIIDDNKNTGLLIFDKKTHELAQLEQNPIDTYQFGHVNDMEYSFAKNEIYIIQNNVIHILDADTFVKKESISVSQNFNGIAIDYSTGNYYLRTEKIVYVYTENFDEISHFDITNAYPKQGISLQNQYLFFGCYSNKEINGVMIENIIYVYKNGKLFNIFSTPEGLGELQAVEFDGDIPYLLFHSLNGKGYIYTPRYEDITINIHVDDETSDITSAELFSNSEKVENVDKVDGKYTFSPLQFAEPGEYKYIIRKKSKERTSDDEIEVNVNIFYDAAQNVLSSNVSYSSESFSDVPDNEITDVDSNEVIDTPIRPGESSNETLEPGTVENPQTGAYLPWIIIPVGLGVITAIVLYRKKVFFKL